MRMKILKDEKGVSKDCISRRENILWEKGKTCVWCVVLFLLFVVIYYYYDFLDGTFFFSLYLGRTWQERTNSPIATTTNHK